MTIVGLVLPADGPAARAAIALRDGFLAAWYELPPQKRPNLTFHSFIGGMVKAAYRAAVEAGATFIIGPLAKEEVQTLAREDLSRPTLALNYLPEEENIPERLYQFGLSPSDEAHQGAQQAQRDGRSRAFIITTSNDWGKRVRDAFRSHWENIGGTVVRLMAAESKPEDLSDTFVKARDNFSPSGSMNGTEFVFLATPAELARRLSPLLQQWGLPVYATSHVLTGTKQDAQLADQQVVDLPWVVNPDPMMVHLRDELQRFWPNDFITYQRIYALGIDAFRLMGELTRLENDATALVHGTTGILSLDRKRRVVRQGTWIRIKGGQISSVNYPDDH